MPEAMCSNMSKKLSQKKIMMTQSQQKGSVSVDKMTGWLSRRPLVDHPDECSRRVCVLVGKLTWRLSRSPLAKKITWLFRSLYLFIFASGQIGAAAVAGSTYKRNKRITWIISQVGKMTGRLSRRPLSQVDHFTCKAVYWAHTECRRPQQSPTAT